MDTHQPLVGIAPPLAPATGRPQVFVADPDTVGTKQMRGVWIDPTQSCAELRCVLTEASLADDFVIVDQVGFGPIMLDEVTSLSGLRIMALTALVFGKWQR